MLPIKAKSPDIRIGGEHHVLRTISEMDVRLAIWERPSENEPPLRNALRDGVALALDTIVDASDPEPALCAALLMNRGHAALSAAWRSDVVTLVRLYAALADASRVRVRLETIRGAACRLFHADYVSLRLLCTYVGRGTEYLDECNVNRAALGQGRNDRIVRDRRQVRCLGTNHVGLFKGQNYPGNAGLGIVHRSPPASRRSPRLVLCLDTFEAPGARDT